MNNSKYVGTLKRNIQDDKPKIRHCTIPTCVNLRVAPIISKFSLVLGRTHTCERKLIKLINCLKVLVIG